MFSFPPKQPASTAAAAPSAADDRRFCERILPEVSRTFALSIGALPQQLSDAIRVAYLLCRLVDTVEDAGDLALDQRIALFDAFDALLADDQKDPGAFEALSVAAFAREADAERELTSRAGATLRCFRRLRPADQQAIRPHVQEMSRGMREYALRPRPHGGLQILDLDDLERYCFFVAGTVGELLTKLFLEAVSAVEPSTLAAIQARAVSFGLGLQLVNIVKDVAQDLLRRDCFLPLALLEQAGITRDQLLDPAHRRGALGVVRTVCARARVHLQAAREYTELWPVPAGAAVRRFCAVPLAFALRTLDEVEQSDDTLRPGRAPKISRELVFRVLAQAQQAGESNAALHELLGSR